MFFCFLHHSLQTTDWCALKSQEIRRFWDSNLMSCTNNDPMVKVKFFIPILMVDVNIKWSSWPISAWLYALHCCHMIGWLINRFTCVPNKVLSECMFKICNGYMQAWNMDTGGWHLKRLNPGEFMLLYSWYNRQTHGPQVSEALHT